MRLGLGNTLVNNGLLNPDLLSLDLNFAADKTLTARRGPKPTFVRSSTATFVGSDGLIQTATTDIPRFDHDPVSPFTCKGLLIEEQRSNLVQYSNNFLNAYWATGASVTSATSSNPDGTTSAFLVTGAGASYVTTYNSTNITVTANTVYTISVYVKAGTVAANTLVMATYDATASGFISAAITPTFTDAGNGWYRATASITTPASCLLLRAYICRTNNFTGTFYIWGAQVEAGAFATSYIPTSATAPLVRSADVCSITSTAFTSFWNQTEGTLLSFSSQPIITATNAEVYAVDNGSDSERFNLRHQSSLALSQVVGASQSTFGMAAPAANAISKIAYAYKLNNYGAARNSVSATSVSNGTIPTVDRVYIGSKGHNSTEYLNGHIQSLRYYKKRLPDAKLQTLTT